MCKYHDTHVGLLEFSNLCVEPGNIPLMRFVVRVDIPMINEEEIIESEADCHMAFSRDGREETASQNDDVGVWHPADCTIQQDKVAERGVVAVANVVFKSTKNVESFGPVRMISFMIPRDKEYSAESPELLSS